MSEQVNNEKLAALAEAGLDVSPHLLSEGEKARQESLEAVLKDEGVQEAPESQNPVEVFLSATDDPFDIVNAPGQNLIVLMRIYDVLMGIYAEQAPDKATALIKKHTDGEILLSYPYLSVD